jgi:hypothetical protein
MLGTPGDAPGRANALALTHLQAADPLVLVGLILFLLIVLVWFGLTLYVGVHDLWEGLRGCHRAGVEILQARAGPMGMSPAWIGEGAAALERSDWVAGVRQLGEARVQPGRLTVELTEQEKSRLRARALRAQEQEMREEIAADQGVSDDYG